MAEGFPTSASLSRLVDSIIILSTAHWLSKLLLYWLKKSGDIQNLVESSGFIEVVMCSSRDTSLYLKYNKFGLENNYKV